MADRPMHNLLAWLKPALLVCLFCQSPKLRAQELSLDLGYRQMYNLQFDAAHRTFAEWEKRNPADPLGPVSDAVAYLFTELDRMHLLESEFFTLDDNFFGKRPGPDPALKRAFERTLAQAEKSATAALSRDAANPDALFASVLRHGLRADYLSLVERSQFAALSETKSGRAAAEKLLSVKPDYHDAHLAVGIENYLLSLKPAPLRLLLRLGGARTDKQEGIAKLRITAEKGRFLLPFARLLLAVAALRERDLTTARAHLSWLAIEFPQNRLYRSELSKLR